MNPSIIKDSYAVGPQLLWNHQINWENVMQNWNE